MTALNTIEDAQNHVLWDQQVALEQEMRSLGIENYRKNAEKAAEKGQMSRIAPVRRLMQETHHTMVEAIGAFYAEVESKKAGRKHSAYPYLKAMDIDVVAHLTCRTILDLSSKRQALTSLAVTLAEHLEDECNYRHFAEQDKAGYRAAAKRVQKTSHQGHKRKSVLASASKRGLDLLEWPKRDMVIVGSKLIEMFVETTGLAVLQKRQDKLFLETSEKAKEWVEKEGRTCELLAPLFMPTIIPPKPWTSPYSGGYWTGRTRRLTLVKSPNRAYLEELAGQDMPVVYEAVNALQNTSWHINTRVFEVMCALWDQGSDAGVVPNADPLPLPLKPVWLTDELKKEDMTEEQLEKFKEWKGECAAIYESNAEAESQRQAFLRMLWIAEKYKTRDEFFYPYTLDWRGRAYPVGNYLQPQGNDANRGLLEFSEQAPINDQEAANWLMIHGAGLWGKDKCSFEERCAWVQSHEAEILASAADPFENRFWMEAEDGDKAWQALAFCFDYAGFKAEGFGYLSALPIQMDGTCNGIQNFSAMLLDERGGAAVNLVPADVPQDIYNEVKVVVEARVNQEAAEGNEFALMWVGRLERKTVKRPVMTLAYGAKRYGFTDMVLTDTVRPTVKRDPQAFCAGREAFKAAQYMGGLIWDAVQEVVVAAARAMEWLQQCASIASKQGLPVYWTAPSGLIVKQEYKVRKMKEIEVTFQKVRLAPRIDAGGDKIDSKKQASGIAPNWVHSLDASHMMLTIRAAKDAGVHSFSFIHDSYGTHAGNTPHLAQLLREQFVDMYGGACVLEKFKTDLEHMMGGEIQLPPVPPKGTLDLSKVLESKFFFA